MRNPRRFKLAPHEEEHAPRREEQMIVDLARHAMRREVEQFAIGFTSFRRSTASSIPAEVIPVAIEDVARWGRSRDAVPARRTLVAILSPFRPAARPANPDLVAHRITVHIDPGFNQRRRRGRANLGCRASLATRSILVVCSSTVFSSAPTRPTRRSTRPATLSAAALAALATVSTNLMTAGSAMIGDGIGGRDGAAVAGDREVSGMFSDIVSGLGYAPALTKVINRHIVRSGWRLTPIAPD